MPEARAVASWNARALVHPREPAQRKKLEFLKEFGAGAQVIHLQEFHGTEVQARRALREALPHHHAALAMHDDAGTGSVATLVAKQMGGKDTKVDSEELAPGRVLRTTVSVGGCVMIHYDVHNF